MEHRRIFPTLGDPMVAEEHITAFNWASTQEIDDMMALTLRVNDFLSGMFGAVGITLVDFKIEYGRIWEGEFSRVILADSAVNPGDSGGPSQADFSNPGNRCIRPSYGPGRSNLPLAVRIEVLRLVQSVNLRM